MEIYREIYRCLKRGGRFFSWHFGIGSDLFTGGGGKKIDKFTIDNIRNKNMSFYNNGVICFLSVGEALKLLSKVGFVNISIEKRERTYKNRTQKIRYLSISAQK
jgi:hypothetical protein